jgi:hypothetical protein
MAYYIFLKSLRSLEEFRNNPHVKIPPKSHSTNFQSLGKFKNPIFNSEILFLDFGAADLAAHSASGPASPLAAPPPKAETVPRRPIQPARRSRLHGKYVFPFGSHLPSRPPLPRLSVNWAPAVSSIAHLQPSEPARAATAPRPPSATQLHASGATGPLPPRLHFPSLKSPLKPSPVFNGVKAINAGVKLPGHPSPVLPCPPIKGEHSHRVSPHLSHFFSPLSTPEQPSDRAPTPPSLHRRRPSSLMPPEPR